MIQVLKLSEDFIKNLTYEDLLKVHKLLLEMIHRREVMYEETLNLYYRICDFSYTKNYVHEVAEMKIVIDILEQEEYEIYNETQRLLNGLMKNALNLDNMSRGEEE